MRTDPTKTPKEPTYQVVLDALALSPLYPAFLITIEVLEIYMHQFWHTITKIKNSPSYKFNLDKKKCTIDVEVFHDILQICPKLPNKDLLYLLILMKKLSHLSRNLGAATPKKARKFKKHASPSKKKALVDIEEPTEKPVKKPDARRQSIGVQIRDTLGVSVSKKKASARLKEAKGLNCFLKSYYLRKLRDRDDDNDDDDQQSDDERTESDDDKSADLNKTDDDEEHKMMISQEVTGDQVKDDAQVTVTAALVTQKTEVLLQSSSISSDYATKFLNFDNIPSAPATTIPPPILPFIPLQQQSTPIPTPTTTEATTSTTTVLDSTTLSAIHQRLSNLENEVKTLKNVDHSSVLLATIKSKVLNVVKEYLGTSLDHALYKVL
ncbi:hypothetical protein Tco_1217071 [Tanacetum coccineum]